MRTGTRRKFKIGKKIVALIFARLGGGRFPRKNFAPINGYPALEVMYKRVRKSKLINEIIIAIPNEKKEMELADFVHQELKAVAYMGHPTSLLERAFECIEWSDADYIVDMTADCPLVDPVHIDGLIRGLKLHKLDYASNCAIRSWPDGFDVQVYTKEALEKAYHTVQNPIHRCHSGWNILEHRKEIVPEPKIGFYAPKKGYWHPEWGLTIDEHDDLKVIDDICVHFNIPEETPTAMQIIEYIMWKAPHLVEINKQVKRKNPTVEG